MTRKESTERKHRKKTQQMKQKGDCTTKKSKEKQLQSHTENNLQDEVYIVLTRRMEELKRILNAAERRIAIAPKGLLRISDRGSYVQYYHRKDIKDTKGKYIKKSEVELVRRLAQKDYDQKICEELRVEIREINRLLERYHSQELESIYNNLSFHRKSLISPVIESDEDYIKHWKEIKYEKMRFENDEIELYTDAGERVRSKSEVIIANKLLKMGVPYRYEYPIQFKSGRIVHPDFYCLNIRKREDIIYEHFGMMDNEEYLNNALRKIDEYQKNGYWLGKNLIATFESSKKLINVYEIEEMIKQYLF